MNVRYILLAVIFLITGSINTLLFKWTDLSVACGVYDCDDGPRHFTHPFVQSWVMFIGKFLCFNMYFMLHAIGRCRSTNENTAPMVPFCKWFLFLTPAMCDMIATSTMYIGLNLTFASSFQMLRGSVILFTGLLSVAFLGSVIMRYQWVGMAVTTVGLICVGVSDVIFNNDNHNLSQSDLNAVIAGDLLIVLAQVLFATQGVSEQRYLTKHNFHPLLAVGLEGLFGMVVIGTLLAVMYYIPSKKPFSMDPAGRLENVLDALAMMRQNWHILVGILGAVLSSAVYNFSSLSITKVNSATARMVLDSGRTLIIWIFSLAVGWQPVTTGSILLQLLGFILLMTGMCIYNNLLFAPFLRRHGILGELRPPAASGDDFNQHPSYDCMGNSERGELRQHIQRRHSTEDDDEPLLSAT